MVHDPDQEKIMLIENMPIDVDEKVELLLMLGGAKSAADIEVLGEAWDSGDDANHTDVNMVLEIEKSLKALGFAIEVKKPVIDHSVLVEDDNIPVDEIKPEDEVHQDRERIVIEVARNETIKAQLERALAQNDHAALGMLYGMPETAVNGFLNEDPDEIDLLFGRSELSEDLRKKDWTLFATYRFSKDNWKKELNTAKQWATMVKMMSPLIYAEYIEKMRAVDKF